MLGLDCSAVALKELERNMGINEDLDPHDDRTRMEKMDATPTVMMQQKSGDSYESSSAA